MEMNNNWTSIEQEAIRQYESDGMDRASILFVRYADMRYVGQEHTVKVQVPNREWDTESAAEAVQRFHELHEKSYTFKLEYTEVEVVSLHVIAFGKVDKPVLKKLEQTGLSAESAIVEQREVYYEKEGWITTTVYDRLRLSPGAAIEGPAIVEEKSSSTVLHPGQQLEVDDYGNLIIHTGVN